MFCMHHYTWTCFEFSTYDFEKWGLQPLAISWPPTVAVGFLVKLFPMITFWWKDSRASCSHWPCNQTSNMPMNFFFYLRGSVCIVLKYFDLTLFQNHIQVVFKLIRFVIWKISTFWCQLQKGESYVWYIVLQFVKTIFVCTQIYKGK